MATIIIILPSDGNSASVIRHRKSVSIIRDPTVLEENVVFPAMLVEIQ